MIGRYAIGARRNDCVMIQYMENHKNRPASCPAGKSELSLMVTFMTLLLFVDSSAIIFS